MSMTINIINLPLIDNYLRIIRSLARRGRNNYQTFLVQPLSKWGKFVPAESLDKLLTLLNQAEENRSKKLPLLYKMALVKSVAPDQFDLSIPGNISLNFLKSMKDIPKVVEADEAREFVNLLVDPFKEYSEKEFLRMNNKFEKDINTADTLEVEKLLKIREGEIQEKEKYFESSKKEIEDIENLLKSNNLKEMRKSIISYLLKFSVPSFPDCHLAINKIFESIKDKFDHDHFEKEIMQTIAVIIYHEILKAIKDKKMDKSVQYIGKYTVLFRGNPDTPNYQEVDSFERKFYSLIEERNLWDKI